MTRTSTHESEYGLVPGEQFEPESEGIAEPFDSHQPHIMTVLGPIRPDELGICLHHEHLWCDPAAVTVDESDYRLDDRFAALAELEAWTLAGGSAIVDASTRDYGRDPAGLRWLAQRSSAHLIMVTGRHKALHAEHLGTAHSVELLRDEFVAEIRDGVGVGAVSPGLIKFGTSLDTIFPIEQLAARAAAQAHLLTGVPITTHTEAGTMAAEQLDLLEDEGVSPRRVILGHLDRALDERSLRALLERGAWVSFDQIGKAAYGPDQPKAAMIARLITAGFGSQLLLSQDLARKTLFPAYGGGPGWTYMLQHFALMLMEAGLQGEDVRMLLVDNPARALSIISPRPTTVNGSR